MACAKEWGALLSKYVDGEATTEERQLVESHLTTCQDCVGTWELFRRNEKILESALAGEAFGDLVVDDVMAEIRRLETPPVVAPAVEASARWVKVRRWMPTVAAAALMVAVLAIVVVSRPPDLSDRLAQLERSQKQHDIANEVLLAKLQDQEAVIDLLRSQKAKQCIAFRSGNSISTKATFENPERVSAFDLQRREGTQSWTTIKKDLPNPEAVDGDVTPGVEYLYRFVGHARDGSTVESEPCLGFIPVDMDARTSLNVKLVGVTDDLSVATFSVERYVDRKLRKYLFQVRPGQAIGGVAAEIDFTTNLYVDRIEIADQIAQYGSRVNKRVKLRGLGSPPTDPTVDLWRDQTKSFPLPR